MPLRPGAECECFVIICLHVETVGGYIYYLTKKPKSADPCSGAFFCTSHEAMIKKKGKLE